MVLLGNSQAVAGAEGLFEEERRADAGELALVHDGDSVAEDLWGLRNCLVILWELIENLCFLMKLSHTILTQV